MQHFILKKYKRFTREVLMFGLKTLPTKTEEIRQMLPCISYKEVSDLKFILPLIAEKYCKLVSMSQKTK